MSESSRQGNEATSSVGGRMRDRLKKFFYILTLIGEVGSIRPSKMCALSDA